ncbi:hypothetical protein KC887_09640 [Candidatus Kaiserbacteria bacterium]|nr:hypothetical protein [Candidatus Kaiserbacteria bacterium]
MADNTTEERLESIEQSVEEIKLTLQSLSEDVKFWRRAVNDRTAARFRGGQYPFSEVKSGRAAA